MLFRASRQGVIAATIVATASQAQPGGALLGSLRDSLAQRAGVPRERIALQWLQPVGDTVAVRGLRLTGPSAAGVWFVDATDQRAQALWTAQVRVGTVVNAPVATRRLPRGTVLSAGDVNVARVVDWGLPVTRATDVLGWVTRRAVNAGERLDPPTVSPQPLVRAGQPVQLIYREQQLQLAVTGTAVISASLGERISVRLGPKRVITGTVTGPATVSALESGRTQ